MLHPYEGHVPRNVNKDAKYAIRTSGDGFKACLPYRDSTGTEFLLAANQHDDLVKMVNDVKRAATGKEGGSFYINEYHHVLVPSVGDKRTYFAGEYSRYLEFPFGGGLIGPVAPEGLKPGDPWPGPHAGVPYGLAASGNDIFRELRGIDAHGQEWKRKEYLSVVVGDDTARNLANRLALVKGAEGGRVYLNEASEFITPPRNPGADFIYVGHLEPDEWFPEPPTPAM